MLSRTHQVLNEAMAHAQEQCHVYRDAIRNDRIALAHWSNAGADEALKEALRAHVAANLERLSYWETFLRACSERMFFGPTLN
jgi:hypothetical protein